MGLHVVVFTAMGVVFAVHGPFKTAADADEWLAVCSLNQDFEGTVVPLLEGRVP